MTKYTQLSIEEREKIYQLLKAGRSLSAVAKILFRHKSTISREIKRNGSLQLGYLPDRADNLSKMRKNRTRSKLDQHIELKEYIIERLTVGKWSPAMISGRINYERKLPRISHETIYQFIYSAQGRNLNLYNNLMYCRQSRQLKYNRRKRQISADQSIHSRPECVNSRSEFGHFEGDLTFFKESKSGSLTVLTERVSRKSMIFLNTSKRSNSVMLKIQEVYKHIPKNTIKSITFDNGGEFFHFGLLSLHGTKVYFCDPGAPYQKGQVERTNALLHKYIPKKSNFHSISEEMVFQAQEQLNDLPRKCLNYRTPNEVWEAHINATNVGAPSINIETTSSYL